jgi:flagellar basal body-associated protein FliL
VRYHETRPEYRRAEVPVIRLLIVLAVVILMAFYMNYNSPRGGGEATTSPEQQYEQATGEAQALEQQMQQQAQSQLDAIDAGTQ